MLRLALLACLALSAGARAESPDWNAIADDSTVELVTADPDGDARETTVWVGVVDGQGYVRTSDTRWRANLEREPDLLVRVADHEYALRAVVATDPALIARVTEVYRAKYGWQFTLVALFGNDGGKVTFALGPRTP